MSELIIGCSGFSYKHWKNVFYPEGLSERKWLEYYSTVFSSVELNVTFYHLPSATAFQSWYRTTPPEFKFAVKGSRYITHVKRLLDIEVPIEKFFAGVSLLREKTSVVLWQFPPTFRINLERFKRFSSLLEKYPFRHTVEFRNETWITPSVEKACREHKIGLCTADSPAFVNDLPVTSDFVYIRRHGHTAGHDGSYTRAQLQKDAARIQNFLHSGLSVYIYFNNDPHGYAPANARQLAGILSHRAGNLKKSA